LDRAGRVGERRGGESGVMGVLFWGRGVGRGVGDELDGWMGWAVVVLLLLFVLWVEGGR
jgi:hypothetical protein